MTGQRGGTCGTQGNAKGILVPESRAFGSYMDGCRGRGCSSAPVEISPERTIHARSGIADLVPGRFPFGQLCGQAFPPARHPKGSALRMPFVHGYGDLLPVHERLPDTGDDGAVPLGAHRGGCGRRPGGEPEGAGRSQIKNFPQREISSCNTWGNMV